MNKKKSSALRGRIVSIIGCFILAVAMAGAYPALAQQKAEPTTINFTAFIPGSHPEMIGFNKGFVSKAVELSKGDLPSNSVVARRPLHTGFTQGDTKWNCRFSINLAGVAETVCPGVGATILSRISVEEERKNGPMAIWISSATRGPPLYGKADTRERSPVLSIVFEQKVEKPEDLKKLRIGTATAAVP